MSKQTTLSKNPPMILDATCSFFRVWPKHASIRMDIRPEVKPDVVGDIKKTEFPGQYFDEIYLDPPHMIRKDNPEYAYAHDKMQIKRRLSGRRTPHAFDRYGVWKTKKDWLGFLDAINIELKRILKPGGIIHFKIACGEDRRMIKRVDMDRLTNFEVLQEKITKSKYPGSKNNVHWITFGPKKTVQTNCNSQLTSDKNGIVEDSLL